MQEEEIQEGDVSTALPATIPKESLERMVREAQVTSSLMAPESFDPYQGISMLDLTDEEIAILEAPVEEEKLEIKPSGEVYASQVHYRRILNKAFRRKWGLREIGKPQLKGKDESTGVIAQKYALFVRGCFVSEVWGEQDYFESNTKQSEFTALESARSNALMRACKDLGIASDCWDKSFLTKWIAKYAIQVWVDGKNRPQWRKRIEYGGMPFYKEKGPVDTGVKENVPRGNSLLMQEGASSPGPTGRVEMPREVAKEVSNNPPSVPGPEPTQASTSAGRPQEGDPEGEERGDYGDEAPGVMKAVTVIAHEVPRTGKNKKNEAWTLQKFGFSDGKSAATFDTKLQALLLEAETKKEELYVDFEPAGQYGLKIVSVTYA